MTATENRLVRGYLIVALIALAVGGLFGPLQALNWAGLDLYGLIPGLRSYYQGLSLHGTLLVLVWTTFFIGGFLLFVTRQSLGQPLPRPGLAWATFWLMVVGLVLAALPLLSNDATVLFTFYAPLKASPLFYLGLGLIVVGTWLLTLTLGLAYRRWRAAHPGEPYPLPAFMALVTMLMWTLASLGIAFEVVFLLLPWSVGLTGGVDALLTRTLFWFTGHPIVYFWLLPAYLSWYTLVPRHAGGSLFSEPMARLSFLLFLTTSIPVGVHHQFTDPGISEGPKLLHTFFTFVVFFPSLLTAFNVAASLESAARRRGEQGWLGWLWRQRWGDPVLTAQLLAMILFIFGGIGGLVNASLNVNLLVHNTAWIVGHFHLTVGSAVTLTFMGVTYWLLPHLLGRQLWSRGLALAQAVLWFVGMAVFAYALHNLGLLDTPRRTMLGAAPYRLAEWQPWLVLVGIGGVILFLSGLLYFVLVVLTALAGERQPVPAPAFAETIHGPADTPRAFDRLAPWLVVSVVLIVVGYGPVFWQVLSQGTPPAVGLRVW